MLSSALFSLLWCSSIFFSPQVVLSFEMLLYFVPSARTTSRRPLRFAVSSGPCVCSEWLADDSVVSNPFTPCCLVWWPFPFPTLVRFYRPCWASFADCCAFVLFSTPRLKRSCLLLARACVRARAMASTCTSNQVYARLQTLSTTFLFFFSRFRVNSLSGPDSACKACTAARLVLL